MQLKTIATFMAFICTSIILAQQGVVQGKVVSSKNVPLSSVNIVLSPIKKGSVSDTNGAFIIKDMIKGRYTLKASLVGFKTHIQEVFLPSSTSVKDITIVLQEKIVSLDEVAVDANKRVYATNKVSSSLRQKTELIKLAQNIQVIDNSVLKDQQVTSIMDGVIRNVSGVTAREHWGHFASIFMRGFRLPAFRNGFNVTDSWGPLAEDMALVENIEFVKGPSSFMLTASEPGGIYNVVTKKPTPYKKGDITLMAGSFDFLRAAADFGGSITKDKKLYYRFNAFYQSKDTHRGSEHTNRFAIAPSITYQITPKSRVNLEWNYQKANVLVGNGYVFAPAHKGFESLPRDFKFRDTNYPTTAIDENLLYLNFNHKLSKNWDFTVQLGRLTANQQGCSAWIDLTSVPNFMATGDIRRSVNIWDSRSEGTYSQAFVNGSFFTKQIKHTILAGVDYTDKKYYADFYSAFIEPDFFNIYAPTYGRDRSNLGFDRSKAVADRYPVPYNGFSSSAVYLQDELGFFKDKLRVTLAGRFTSLTTINKTSIDERFTPRVGLNFNLTPDITLYGLYDNAFLAQSGVLASGDPVDAVKATDLEAGVKTSFFNNKLKATLGAYIITKNDLALGVPGTQYSEQTGEVRSKGIEFDLQGEILPGLNAILNYANTNVEITKDLDPKKVGNRLAGHAKHVTNGWFTYTFNKASLFKGFAFSAGYQYQIDRSSWTIGADNKSILPDYFRLDAGLSWQKDKFKIQANINNITDAYLFSGSSTSGLLSWQSEPGINGSISLSYSIF